MAQQSTDLVSKLRQARLDRDLSIPELAAHLGVSERTFGYWMSGTTEPQPRHRRAIRAFLDKETT